jgi:hypothetical protein
MDSPYSHTLRLFDRFEKSDFGATTTLQKRDNFDSYFHYVCV